MIYSVVEKDPNGVFQRTVSALNKEEALIKAFREIGYGEEDLWLDPYGYVEVSDSWKKQWPHPFEIFSVIPLKEESNAR